MMRFQLLGPLQATADGVSAELGGHKQRVVLAALLLHPNEVVPIDRLIEWVWSGDPPRTASHSIHIYVSELRKALEAIGAGDSIVTQDPGYVIMVPAGSIDIERFEELLRSADTYLSTGDAREAADQAERALALWHGEALADFTYDEFAQDEIRLLDERRLSAEALLTRAQLDTGNIAGATDRLRRLSSAHPLHEEIHRLLMEALYRQGRPAEALRLFQRLRQRLGDELGIDPSRALFELEERILLHDPTLGRAGADAPTRNPFKGLRPFEEADAPDFFGRTSLVASALSTLAGGQRFLSLVGPSGAGKSSVTRAGLLPAVRSGEVPGSESWTIAVITPGHHPLDALYASLTGPTKTTGVELASILALLTDRPLLLVVDQFEELFTLVEDEWVRQGFLDVLAEALATASSDFRLIITMRGDFYDRPLMYPAFGDLFANSVVSIMPLTPAELGEAVAGPAQQVGTAAEPQLVAALVADVAGRSGALPLFQYSLTELFNRTAGNTLTLDDYRSIGGLEGALVGQAERAYADLTESQQRAARQIMLRLVQIGVDDATALRRIPASEVSSLPTDPLDIHEALDQFGRLRLVSFDRSPAGTATIEIAHEALLTTWPRLEDWIETSRSDLRKRAALKPLIDAWIQAGEDPDYLPVGAQLEELERWSGSSDLALTALEQRFVDAARRHQITRQEEADHAADETRILARRARLRLWVLIAVLVLLAGASVTWFVLVADRAGPKVALIYDGRGDQSFGDMVASGWDRAARATAFQGEEIVPIADPTSEITSAAEAGHDLIIAGGIPYTQALESIAPAYPKTWFATIDEVLDLPNVTSYLFAHDEGSYLAGVAAALASDAGTVGFVGGLPIPIIEEFWAGFEAGVLATNPAMEVVAIYVGTDFGTGFARPDLGRTAAELLLAEGADVVYHAAGLSGWGVLDAVVTHAVTSGDHVWFIGVDTDQYLQADDVARPYILTSMLKRADVAIEDAINGVAEGTLDPGVRRLGVVDEGVSLAESGDHLVPFAVELTDARARLLTGTVQIPPPSGRLLERPVGPTPTLEYQVTFDGSSAQLAGPSPVAGPAPARVLVDNGGDAPAFVAFVPLLDDSMDFEELRAQTEAGDAADVPDFLAPSRAQGGLVAPGRDSITVELGLGRWAVFCLVEVDTINVSYLAGLVEVTP